MKKIVFFDEHKNDFFRYWVYKKPGLWTPYEQEARLCKITNYTIINEDILLELDIYDFDTHEHFGYKEYRYLKDISLSLYEYDNKERELEDDMYE